MIGDDDTSVARAGGRGEDESGSRRNWFAPLTRRGLLDQGAGAGLALATGALLAACGSSSSSSTTSSVGAATSATTPAGTSTSASPPSSAIGEQLRTILNLPTGKAAGQGLQVLLGGDFALSGPGSSYGIPMYMGALHGVSQVAAAGGPNFKLIARDTNSLTTGIANTREFGTLGVPAILASQGGAFGGGAPFYKRYKMWAVDAGAAERYNNGLPYFYQGRAAFPAGLMGTIIAYNKAKRPQAKRWSFLAYSIAGAAGTQSYDMTVAQLRDAGYEVATPIVTVPLGVTDFSTAFAQIAEQKPDLILSEIVTGADAGVMLKQYLTAGIGKKIVSLDFTPQYSALAGPEAIKSMEFCFDYFVATAPGNDWGDLFVSSWKETHSGALPIYYSANFYEQTFTVWELIRRVIAAGGDPTKQGALYVNAMNENGTLPSVYGGPGAHGSMTFDLTTHALLHRPVAYGQALANGTGTIYASGDTTGAGFHLTAAGMAAPSNTDNLAS
jgi:hypothetical protein